MTDEELNEIEAKVLDNIPVSVILPNGHIYEICTTLQHDVPALIAEVRMLKAAMSEIIDLADKGCSLSCKHVANRFVKWV